MQTVQHDLTRALGFVGQLDLGKCDWLLLPVSSEVRTVRMSVDRALRSWFRLSSSKPLSVDILPPVSLYLLELQQHCVHGTGIQTTDARLNQIENYSMTEEMDYILVNLSDTQMKDVPMRKI